MCTVDRKNTSFYVLNISHDMFLCSTTEDSENSIKSEPSTKEEGMDLFAQDAEAIQINTDLYPESDGTLTQETCLIGEDGGVGAPQPGSQPLRQPRKRRLPGGDPWRLRLDYLVAYGPQGQDTFCMVCSQVLHETKVSSFRRHIKESHPETTTLSRQEREAMAAAWTKDYSSEDMQTEDGEMISANVTCNSETESSPILTKVQLNREVLFSVETELRSCVIPLS